MLAAGRNVLALWQAQGRVQGEKTVEAQLQCTFERLNAAVPERARERQLRGGTRRMLSAR
jgi:hypothetical protein